MSVHRVEGSPAPARGGPARSTAARWSGWGLGVCALAGLVAAASVGRTWARATLSDRGSALLVVTRSGWSLRPTGQLVVAVGLLAALLCLLAHRAALSHRHRWARGLVTVLPVAGAVIVALAASRLHAADTTVHTMSRLRIGTFQTDEPVVTSTVGVGLWAALAAGIVLVLAAVYWLVAVRETADTEVVAPAYPDVPSDGAHRADPDDAAGGAGADGPQAPARAGGPPRRPTTGGSPAGPGSDRGL